MLLFLYIYGTNIGICNSGVGKMKHPAFIFVLTKKEVLMVSVELKQEKHNALKRKKLYSVFEKRFSVKYTL